MAIKTLKFLCAIIYAMSIGLTSCSVTSKPSNISIAPTPTEEQIEIIQSGNRIEADGYGEIKLLSVLIFDDIQIQGYQFDRKQGVKRLVIILNAKNLATDSIDAGNFISASATYKNAYNYEIIDFMEDGDMEWPVSLAPLKVASLYCVIEVPDEVAAATDDITIIIKFNNKKYLYSGVIESVYEYIDTLYNINAELEQVLNEIGNITTTMNFTFDPGPKDFIEWARQFSAQQQKIDSLYSQLISLSNIPPYYSEGHKTYLNGITKLNEGLKYAGDGNVALDKITYGQSLVTGGQLISDAEALLTKADEQLLFLNWYR